LSQTGGSGTGHHATLSVTGSTNTIGITQQGTVSNLTNLAVSGSSNTYTILQKN